MSIIKINICKIIKINKINKNIEKWKLINLDQISSEHQIVKLLTSCYRESFFPVVDDEREKASNVTTLSLIFLHLSPQLNIIVIIMKNLSLIFSQQNQKFRNKNSFSTPRICYKFYGIVVCFTHSNFIIHDIVWNCLSSSSFFGCKSISRNTTRQQLTGQPTTLEKEKF